MVKSHALGSGGLSNHLFVGNLSSQLLYCHCARLSVVFGEEFGILQPLNLFVEERFKLRFPIGSKTTHKSFHEVPFIGFPRGGFRKGDPRQLIRVVKLINRHSIDVLVFQIEILDIKQSILLSFKQHVPVAAEARLLFQLIGSVIGRRGDSVIKDSENATYQKCGNQDWRHDAVDAYSRRFHRRKLVIAYHPAQDEECRDKPGERDDLHNSSGRLVQYNLHRGEVCDVVVEFLYVFIQQADDYHERDKKEQSAQKSLQVFR